MFARCTYRRFELFCQRFFCRTGTIFYHENGGEGGIRPLCRPHHVGSGVDSPALADADVLPAFLTLSQRSLRFESPKDPYLLDFKWRRGRDSNPRYGFTPYTRLAGERLQPTRPPLRIAAYFSCPSLGTGCTSSAYNEENVFTLTPLRIPKIRFNMLWRRR